VAILRGCCLRPVEAVQTWLAAAEISVGPVFRPVLSAFSAAQSLKGVRRARRPGRGAVRRSLAALGLSSQCG
jgi:hypothetical protein